MLELLLKSLISSGPIGVILAVMIWDNIQMKKKLFKVIENNTKAITNMSNSINELSKAKVP